MRLLAIINPISGYARSRRLPFLLRRELVRNGFKVDFHYTRFAGDARNVARNASSSYDLIIAAGGDGTINEVAGGIYEGASRVPMAIFPTGTENLFAKELKIRSDIASLIETLKWGKTAPFDLAMVNGRVFLLVSGIGFDAQVLLHLNSFRRGNITHLTYFWPIWRTFWEYRFAPLTVYADGELIIDKRPALVFVGNISRYAVGLRICRFADPQDGLLDLCIYLCEDQFKLLSFAVKTVLKKHTEDKDVIYKKARSISVSSQICLPLQTDGDPAGYLPAEYSVIPSGLNVILPPYRY